MMRCTRNYPVACVLIVLVVLLHGEKITVDSLSTSVTSATADHWMDFLKFDGSTPEFDVIEKTKEFAASRTYEDAESFYDEKYVFRGSIVGPITAKDVRETQKRFNVMGAYPDIEFQQFGFAVDPENPYRCYFFERWRGTNTEGLQVGPIALPATNKEAVIPTHVMSVNWTPKGKIIYHCLSAPLDRFEGNTMGQGAVMGLLYNGGIPLPPSSVGDLALIANQKFVAPLIQQKAFSNDEDIPNWWKSKSKGADPTDI